MASNGPARFPLNKAAWQQWAEQVGPMTHAFAKQLLAASIGKIGARSLLGLRRAAEKRGHERTELACERAYRHGARSYKSVARILALGRENAPMPDDESGTPEVIHHGNVRGTAYYH